MRVVIYSHEMQGIQTGAVGSLQVPSASLKPDRCNKMAYSCVMKIFEQQLLDIVTDSKLSFRQKSRNLALVADSLLPIPKVSDVVSDAMDAGFICDMLEGHAPYKPRYVLPDYERFLAQGSCYLELPPATDLDEALNHLLILYHHVPSVTDLPVFLGHLDSLLLPYVGALVEADIYKKLKLFWIQLDRTLPDAFVHANIGPSDNMICRILLSIDAELKQIVPNLTFMYDPDVTPDDLLRQVTRNICECSKPHVANFPLHQAAFESTGFGIVSCYNVLPLGGGANTLVRLNLKRLAEVSTGVEDFFSNQLPRYSALMFELIESRTEFLHQQSGFFESFLIDEGLIYEDRFAPMWGVYGMAEAVNCLAGIEQTTGSYGHNSWQNELGHKISAALSDIVMSTPVSYGLGNRALLHSQAGLSIDEGITPGTRIQYGCEPDVVEHIKAIAAHHQYYTSGISDILTIEETVKANPEAMYQLCKGALSLGLREFTANVMSNDLVRVTGYMVKLSDIKAFNESGSRKNTTILGAEAVEKTGILARKPRVISRELEAGISQ